MSSLPQQVKIIQTERRLGWVSNIYILAVNLVTVSEVVSETHEGFPLCHRNAQMINKPKIDYLLYTLAVDALCIT